MFAARHEQSSSDEEEADKSFSSFMKIVNSERTEDMVKMERELTKATASLAEALKLQDEEEGDANNNNLASVETIQAVVKQKQEKISIIKLRTQLFLRFRLAVRKVVEPRLTAKVKKIEEDPKGDYFVENNDNLNRDMEYAFFLKQLEKDLKAGYLSSFLRAKGIVDLADLFATCEFALKGDKQAFDHVHNRIGLYYIEEEVSHCNSLFSAPFDKESTLDLIKHVSFSEVLQMNCRKMVDYLSRL